MTNEELIRYREHLSKFNELEQQQRDLYLRKLANGELQGPPTGYPSIDKPWLKNYSEEQINAEMFEGNLFSYLKKCISDGNFQDKIAINYYGKKISYDDLINKKIIETAKSLSALGLKSGDKISLCLPTIPETIYLFFAANMLGIIVNLIDPRINDLRIEECLGDDTKALFTIDAYNEKIAPIAKKKNIINSFNIEACESLPLHLKMLYRLKKGKKKFDGLKSWSDFKKISSKVDTVAEYYEKDVAAAIVYTSGTTGVPKGAMLSNENIISVSFQQKYVLPDMKAGDSFLYIMPPFIAYGLVCGMCATLTTGLELIVIPKFEKEKFTELILKHRPNIIMGVPAFYEELINKKEAQNADLSFVKYMIAGGDKMNVESEKLINPFLLSHGMNNKIIKGYGMTEVSSGVFITHDDTTNILGSTGQPMIKNNVMVVDTSTGTELQYDNPGEIYIKSSSIMLGYVNNDIEEKKVKIYDQFGECWVKSGDLGYVDSEGNVTISGRLKRMIVRPDGHNVFPTPIEEVIMSHPAVVKCVVIGTKSNDSINGLIPTACIVLREQYKEIQDVIEKQLIELSLKKLPPRDVALRYEFFDEIKLTPMGKVDFKFLEESINGFQYKIKR